MEKQFDRIGDLTVRLLRLEDLEALTNLQAVVYEALPDKSNFVMSTKLEFEESIAADFCVGAFDNDLLAAVTIMIKNRKSPRNIGYVMKYNYIDCVTYDTTFVHSAYRGRGLQRKFIDLKDRQAALDGAKYAFATVSPHNSFSLKNLNESGFSVVDRRIMYNGFDRCILKKELTIAEKEV